MDNKVINLADFRAGRERPPERAWTIRALGKNHIVIEIYNNGQNVGSYQFADENVNRLLLQLRAAVRVAEQWDAPLCPACGAKNCQRWHTGLLLERNDGSGERYWVEGQTARGRHRLRPMNGGKTRYSIATQIGYWGRVVGYAAVDAEPTESPSNG